MCGDGGVSGRGVEAAVTLERGCAGCALSQVRVGGVASADREGAAGEESKQPSP